MHPKQQVLGAPIRTQMSLPDGDEGMWMWPGPDGIKKKPVVGNFATDLTVVEADEVVVGVPLPPPKPFPAGATAATTVALAATVIAALL